LFITSSAFGQQSAINGGVNKTAIFVGTMADRAGKPVTSVEIVIKDSTDKIVSGALSNEIGRYCISDLPPGRYTITRTAGNSAVPGGTVVVDLPPDGLTINWRVARDSSLVTAVDPGAAANNCAQYLAGSGTNIGTLSSATKPTAAYRCDCGINQ